MVSVTAVAGAAASCDSVLGIETYGPGPSVEAGMESGAHDASADSMGEGGPCVDGDKRCSGNGVETCAKGTWGPPSGCPSSQTCSGGTCAPTPPSCQAGGVGMTSCGAGGGGTASCCSTGTEVPNGAFYRSYDGVTPGYESKAYPAIVSAFRLDAYEVTVGRFRRFVDQVVRGWLPSPGSGKHTELFGGTGLETTSGGHEGGWDSAWDSTLSTTAGAWNTNLSGGTWTPSVGSNENLPISQITWYEAYAFCIWDDAFLPSEAEWDYAAAGGSDQRVRPWSIPGSTGISCLQANYGSCTTQTANAVGSESPAGDGKWGHSDLGGNVWEWTLDYYASYAPECMDCANLTPGSNRVLRGGSFHASASLVLASNRFSAAPTARLNDVGTRCARTP